LNGENYTIPESPMLVSCAEAIPQGSQ
jgi:hypothetical protein